MHERNARGLAVQRQRPVERGIATSENDDTLSVQLLRIADAVVDVPFLPFL